MLLPLRLLLYVFLLPLLLFKLLVGGIAMIVLLPVMIIAAIAVGAALAIPLLPLFLVALFIWLLVRSTRTTAIASR